jgi:predicted DNA-binding transcriptional regulator AlpA
MAELIRDKSTADLAKLLKLAKSTIWEMVRDPEFPVDDVRTPGTQVKNYRFNLAEVRAYLRDRNMAPLRTDYLEGKVKRPK